MTETLTVNCSPTAKSLPIRAGLRHGTFARRGIDLCIVSNENSKAQRTNLANNEFQVVHVAFHNAVAMRDVDGLDVVVFMGGDSGMNELFVQPHVSTPADIRGGRLVVDAPDTAFALQAYRILADHGLRRGATRRTSSAPTRPARPSPCGAERKATATSSSATSRPTLTACAGR